MAEVQKSGPLPGTGPAAKFTQGLWVTHFGHDLGIKNDVDGSAFALTLPPSSDVAEVGSGTIVSIAKVGGFPLEIPSGTTQSIEIPPSTNPTIGRTDLIVARFDSATFTTSPGPVRLFRVAGTEGSAADPSYDFALPSPTSMALWAVTRKQGQSLNQATVRDMRQWSGENFLVAPGGTLPRAAPLGSRATRDGITYRRDFVAAAVDWVKEWLPTNAVGATVYDTDWINLSLTTGWKATTGQTPQVRRIGPTVYIRGRVETVSGSNAEGTITPCYMPSTAINAGCAPSRDHDYVQQVNVGGGSYRIWVGTDGKITTLGFPPENNLYIATSYAVD